MIADAGADDVVPSDETIEVFTPREAMYVVESKLVENHYRVSDASLVWMPKNEMDLDTDESVQVMGLIEKLEELDDVQSVASTLHITDEIASAFEAA